MRLEDFALAKVISVTPQTHVKSAFNKMIKNNIHHLLVKRNGTTYGVLSSRDVCDNRDKLIRVLADDRVKEHMTPYVVSAPANTTIKEAANIMRGRKVGSLFVMDNDNQKVIGIVTISDLMELVGRGEIKESQPNRRPVLNQSYLNNKIRHNTR